VNQPRQPNEVEAQLAAYMASVVNQVGILSFLFGLFIGVALDEAVRLIWRL
jgi:hypothetical protein